MKLLKATLLIAGTTIGGGMLALLILTASVGLVPTLILYFICCLVMMCTGLILLDASLWYKEETNLLTLAKRTLGPVGEACTLVLYLFLFYSLMTAYVAGVGELLGTFIPMSAEFLKILGVLIVFPFLIGGTSVVGGVNGVLMVLLFVSYAVFIVLGLPLMQMEHFKLFDVSKIPLALPVIFTAFSYQGTLPSVIHYLERDRTTIRKAIVLGTLIPLVIYIFWQFVVVGIVPVEGPHGLNEALVKGNTAMVPLTHWIQSPALDMFGWLFGFCALVTSFLGVSLGLYDFINDGLKGRGYPLGTAPVLLLALLPPLIINLTYPGLFLKALDVAGGIGCALLLGLLPILMAWTKRGPVSISNAILWAIAIFLSLEVVTELIKIFS